jgi:hypothetical protein
MHCFPFLAMTLALSEHDCFLALPRYTEKEPNDEMAGFEHLSLLYYTFWTHLAGLDFEHTLLVLLAVFSPNRFSYV